MPRCDAEQMGDRRLARLYMARRMGEARSVEAVLDARGVDYVVAVEPYWTRTLLIFPTQLNGAAFYVEADRVEDCVTTLVAAGLALGLVHDLP